MHSTHQCSVMLECTARNAQRTRNAQHAQQGTIYWHITTDTPTIKAIKDQAWHQYKVNDGSNKLYRHQLIAASSTLYYHQLDTIVELPTINVLNDGSMLIVLVAC